MPNPTYLVPFLPGDGNEVMLTVIYISDFPRGVDGTCAYCHGDPCGEEGGDTLIAKYMTDNTWAGSCPLCDGRPT